MFFTDSERTLLQQAGSRPPKQAAAALRQMAWAFWRAGDEGKFAETFRRAFVEKPAAKIREDIPAAELRDIALALLRHGVLYAPVIALLAVAQAQLGNKEDVRRLVDFRRFLHRGFCAVPHGASAEDFNAALALEIKSDLTFYEAPRTRAIRRGWRNNAAMQLKTPALLALRQMLQAEVDRYTAALPDDSSHPFLAARPRQPQMSGWAVVSGAASHHQSHIHSHAWITGVYYVKQPEVSRGSQRGWLRVGPPREKDISQRDGWDTMMIEPAQGSFVLMPAYFYHETEPMGVDQERICIAFEMQPAELAQAADRDGY